MKELTNEHGTIIRTPSNGQELAQAVHAAFDHSGREEIAVKFASDAIRKMSHTPKGMGYLQTAAVECIKLDTVGLAVYHRFANLIRKATAKLPAGADAKDEPPVRIRAQLQQLSTTGKGKAAKQVWKQAKGKGAAGFALGTKGRVVIVPHVARKTTNGAGPVKSVTTQAASVCALIKSQPVGHRQDLAMPAILDLFATMGPKAKAAGLMAIADALGYELDLS